MSGRVGAQAGDATPAGSSPSRTRPRASCRCTAPSALPCRPDREGGVSAAWTPTWGLQTGFPALFKEESSLLEEVLRLCWLRLRSALDAHVKHSRLPCIASGRPGVPSSKVENQQLAAAQAMLETRGPGWVPSPPRSPLAWTT